MVLLFAGCNGNEESPVPSIDVQSVLNDYTTTFTKGGAVALVQRSDGSVYSGAVGESHPGTNLSVDMSMAVGSITKNFTAVLTLKLIEEGRLHFDDNIHDIIPEWTSDKINGNVTVKQLLGHSSGIENPLPGADGLFNRALQNPTEEITLQEYFEAVGEPVFEPGTQYDYSNANYMLLGLIIEKVAGTAYYTHLREEILSPLQLTNTWIMNYEAPTNIIGHCWFQEESLQDLDRTAIESMGRWSGSMFSNVGDLAN